MRFAGLAMALVLAACGGEEPAAGKPALALLTLLASPEHGTISLRDPAAPEEARVLIQGYASVRAPAMHHDGKRFCFVGRLAEEDAPWRLFTASVEGAAAEPLAAEPLAADADEESTPAWLPDGRIVFDARADDASRALFVVAPAGGAAQRITFGGTDAHDPCVLKDGRILYAGTRTTPEGAQAPTLFAVHPDGTGVLLFHGATPGEAYLRPEQQADDDVLFFVRRGGETSGFLAHWRAPHTAAKSQDPNLPRVPVRDACAVAPRPRPQGHMSMVDPSVDAGSLLCVDARRGVAPAAGFVRFFARVLQPDAGAFDWQELGRVPLESDGSFFASVPADTPLRIDVHAADGALLQESRTPFWVRPGEIRGCTGCHEDPDVTPPNRQPVAALEAAVVPRRLVREGGR